MSRVGEESLPPSIFVVRHAEKAVGRGLEDVGLTPAGRTRAQALASVEGIDRVEAVFVTPYRRTAETARPTLNRCGVQAQTYPANDVAGVARRALGVLPGSVLVVGHCDTVPEIVRRLGVKAPGLRYLTRYGDLFRVDYGPQGPTLVHGLFGSG